MPRSENPEQSGDNETQVETQTETRESPVHQFSLISTGGDIRTRSGRVSKLSGRII